MKTIITFLFIIVFFVLPCITQGQSSDSLNQIEQEILSYKDTDMQIIMKSRQMIIDRLNENDIKKIDTIVQFLHSRFAVSKKMTFWQGEKLLLHYILSDYTPLLDTVNLTIKRDFEEINTPTPPPDLLFSSLKDYTISHKQEALSGIEASSLQKYEKAFLTLFLDIIASHKDSTGDRQESINTEANLYFSMFPDSPYNNFIRKNFRYVYKESDWGWGFFMGSGYGDFSGNLRGLFTSSIPLDMGFDGGYKQFVGYLRFYIGIGSKTLKAINYNGNWKDGLRLNVYIPEFSIGYVIHATPLVKLAPFAGISLLNIEPPEKIKEEPGNDVSLNMFSSTIGLNFDYKIGAIGTDGSSYPFLSQHENGNFIIRVRFGYTMPFSPPEDRFDGSMYYLTISFGGFGKPLERDY